METAKLTLWRHFTRWLKAQSGRWKHICRHDVAMNSCDGCLRWWRLFSFPIMLSNMTGGNNYGSCMSTSQETKIFLSLNHLKKYRPIPTCQLVCCPGDLLFCFLFFFYVLLQPHNGLSLLLASFWDGKTGGVTLTMSQAEVTNGPASEQMNRPTLQKVIKVPWCRRINTEFSCF